MKWLLCMYSEFYLSAFHMYIFFSSVVRSLLALIFMILWSSDHLHPKDNIYMQQRSPVDGSLDSSATAKLTIFKRMVWPCCPAGILTIFITPLCRIRISSPSTAFSGIFISACIESIRSSEYGLIRLDFWRVFLLLFLLWNKFLMDLLLHVRSIEKDSWVSDFRSCYK